MKPEGCGNTKKKSNKNPGGLRIVTLRIGDTQIALVAKSFYKFSVENRLEGDRILVEFVFGF